MSIDRILFNPLTNYPISRNAANPAFNASNAETSEINVFQWV